jgi:FAD/FMN-containing dehydrogenase/Fe-S oxidoreductase
MAIEGSTLEKRLRQAVEGEVLFDRFSRGRYATDASIYQVMPLGVVVPRHDGDVAAALAVAREAGVPVLPRGGGTSQCGQTVNEAIVLDLSKHLTGIDALDLEARRVSVEPGVVLDRLNAWLAPHGLWFPVDVSTASRATIGGMTANNSCGSRSIRYGTMRDNVAAIDAILADGSEAHFGDVDRQLGGDNLPTPLADLFRDLLDLGATEAEEIRARFPNLMRRVGGYNIDALVPNGPTNNLSHLLVGSEGTLAYAKTIYLKLAPKPRETALGVCHFPTFRAAMEAAQHLVTLEPTAVELVDRTMIELGLEIDLLRPTVERFVRGAPEALLLVEFAEPERAENLRRLAGLSDVMAELGFAWGDPGKREGGVVEATDPAFQKEIWEVRKQGLNIMMSMKSDGKPVSFVEDCAVRLEDLADYTERLTEIFRKHGTDGTWYAHASVGTLHVRPILNMKLDKDVAAMRAIAEEAFEMVRTYKGSHSGEHGDGIVRSEFHRDMFGDRLVDAFERVKDRMDPEGVFNPGRIVRAPKMDARGLFRYGPDYTVPDFATHFDWSAYTGKAGGFQGAVEMCNNNGACRKLGDGVMCPSYRVTRNERDLVRGRANSLRLAISGQLGPGALTSEEMAETLSLCVSCKACKRECPTGVDMAKMKIEVLAARAAERGVAPRERLVAYLPRYAPLAARVPTLMNLRDRVPGFAAASERFLGLARSRPLPRWQRDPYRESADDMAQAEAVLFADTFNRYFEPENLRAARDVLRRAGVRLAEAQPPSGQRPLCCGRTFLAAGLVEEAKVEMRRTLAALTPALEAGALIVGLEPSCLLTFRDEAPSLLGNEAAARLADQALLLEEFIARRLDEERFDLPLAPLPSTKALLHGHCHQKAFAAMAPVERVLGLIPNLEVETIASSCCGMAGSFGYQAETAEVSLAMAELSLLPKVRAAGEDSVIVADGTSCRHQITDGAGREPLHVARLLAHSAELAAEGR